MHSEISQHVLVRRSTRSHNLSVYPKDYHCHLAYTAQVALIDSNALPNEHYALVSTISQYIEPNSYEEASKHKGWVEAMNKEVDALMASNT